MRSSPHPNWKTMLPRTVLPWLALLATALPAAVDDHFEKHVRPVLQAHCLACHGPMKQRGGLRLDTAAAFRKGGDTGPLVEAVATDSLLLRVLRHDGPVKMPPRGKLADRDIAALTAWVRRGAPWPDTPPATAAVVKDGKRHWAFQPVRKPPVPVTRQPAFTPIDRFVLARLDAAGLTPSPAADRRNLIRRLTFDLLGLPPTPDEVDAFLADNSPDAYPKLVDRLLASPAYGERWGRHWLDVARYSDTKGYVRLTENPNYHTAWTYRDYVVRSFNEDLPYDRFVVEQLAADRLPLGDDPRPLAALGFLTLGERFINSQHDIIDDRIDVVTRGLLGLTVSCARCHDHKFDPVPTRDYYSLHGVFASSLEPRVPPVIVTPAERTRYATYLAELRRRTDRLDAFLRDQHARLTADFRAKAADYLLAAQKEQVQANFVATMFLVDATKDLNPVVLQRWARLLDRTRKQHHPVLAPWHAFASNTPPGKPVNPHVAAALARAPAPRDLAAVADRYRQLFAQSQKGDDADWKQIRALLHGPDAPSDFPLHDLEDYLYVDATVQNQLHAQQKHVEDWVASPGAAPHAAAIEDAPTPADPRVFVRGNASNPGVAVPRQFLEVLSRGDRRPFAAGSGRLDLARAIADRENPLTARVFVNRVWMHHFGNGLVRTPSDFGTRGDPPTHPELLDWLAATFVEDGWSVKALHRRILLSATYRQASLDNPFAKQKDPENLLLWKMHRRRLDWEAMRDSLLVVSGGLDRTIGGRSVEVTKPPFSARRSVYAFIDRQNLPGVLRAFDVAGPEASSPQRHLTTVPQQSLFLLNSPFLRERATGVAGRARLDDVHRLLYGRGARSDEVALARAFLADDPAAWPDYVQVLLLANEFAFVD